MNNFSDYIVFVDESGDHGLNNLDQGYPVFVLAFCIFKKDVYINKIAPDLQKFKFKYWGHDCIVLHENDIRRNMGDGYKILTNPEIRKAFMSDLSSIIDNSPFEVVASVIKKDQLCIYPKPDNPYELSLVFCMERLMRWLTEQDELGKSISIVFESRGKVEDSELELAFRRICDNAAICSFPSKVDFSKIEFDIHFLSKKSNSLGLQLADLVARPIGLHVLRPDQTNQAFAIIERKLIRSNISEKYNGIGLKVFPS